MNCRRFIPETDYPTMQEWLLARDKPCMPLKFLPTFGVVVSGADGPIALGFLIKTDCQVAIISHLASDPDSDRLVRSEAVDLLLATLTDVAKELGFLAVNAATNLPHLAERYVRHGWLPVDEGLTGFWRDLCLS
jgi:hypothetical protein